MSLRDSVALPLSVLSNVALATYILARMVFADVQEAPKPKQEELKPKQEEPKPKAERVTFRLLTKCSTSGCPVTVYQDYEMKDGEPKQVSRWLCARCERAEESDVIRL